MESSWWDTLHKVHDEETGGSLVLPFVGWVTFSKLIDLS